MFSGSLPVPESLAKLDTAKASSMGIGSSIFGEDKQLATTEKLFHTPEVKLFGAKDLNSGGATLFGRRPVSDQSGGDQAKQLFGISSIKAEPERLAEPQAVKSSQLFSSTTTFGSKSAATTGAGLIFGAKPDAGSKQLFVQSGKADVAPTTGGGLFGKENAGGNSSALFGMPAVQASSGLTFQVNQKASRYIIL